jgi:hypothetical protein
VPTALRYLKYDFFSSIFVAYSCVVVVVLVLVGVAVVV